MIEVLVVLGVISVLGGLGYVAVTNVQEAARVEKLNKDVASVNSAVDLYLLNGGSFTGDETPAEILTKLKAASATATNQGASGSFVDMRLTAVMAEEGSTYPRAVWRAEEKGFAIANSGPGVKEFVLGEIEVVAPEARDVGRHIASDGRGWIWDYAPTNALSSTTPEGETPEGEDPSSTPAATPSPTPVSPPSPTLRRLAAPTFNPPGGVIELSEFALSLPVQITNPNGTGRLHYSMPGQSGSTLGAAASVQLARGAVATIYAWVVSTDPANWLNSEVSTAQYIIIMPSGADSEAVGAVVGSGDIKGVFYGSLIFSNPSGNLIFNANGKILGGNLYLPGTPRIEILPSPNLVVDSGQPFTPGAVEIPRDVIGGKEFSIDGTLLSDTPGVQIVDMSGSAEPSNYLFRFNANSYLEGKLYRRANPPALPTVTLPDLGASKGSVNVGSSTVHLAGGDYSNIRMNNSRGVLRLGNPDSEEPVDYIFRASTFNNGRVEVVGPVKIYFTGGLSVKSGFAFGDDQKPELLQILATSGGIDLQPGGLLSARLVAPNSDIDLKGTFRGTLIGKTLSVTGNGVVFNLPPVIGE